MEKKVKIILFISLVLIFILIIFNIEDIYYNIGLLKIKNTKCDPNRECITDYIEFIDKSYDYKTFSIRNKEFRNIITLLESPFFVPMINFTLQKENLDNVIKKNLNIDFLSNHLKESEINSSIISSIEYPEYIENIVLFNDLYVGRFEARILIPKQKKQNSSSIIILHGHSDNNQNNDFPKFGEIMAKEGIITAMPSFRAMDLEEDYVISRLFIENGFRLMGVRLYETMILSKFLRNYNFTKEDSIGILGHSGGSSVGILYTGIDPNVKLFIYDNELDYTNLLSYVYFFKKYHLIHCETLPFIYPYQDAIKDPSNLNIPYIKSKYGFEDDVDIIVEFVKNNL